MTYEEYDKLLDEFDARIRKVATTYTNKDLLIYVKALNFAILKIQKLLPDESGFDTAYELENYETIWGIYNEDAQATPKQVHTLIALYKGED